MANFKQVNKAVRDAFPGKNIEVVRGEGYIYFDGPDGFDKYDSIYTHPTSTNTETVIRMVLEHIRYTDENGRDDFPGSIWND